VSLTINETAGASFGVNIIPHTQSNTTLGKLAVGARVNLEVDQLARYVERLLSTSR
jgi:riboflavin synthase